MDRVCHFEIPYADRDRAADFYQNVFGWQVMHMDEMPYSFCITTPTGEDQIPTEPGGINGGMYERGEGSDSPVVVMQVDSCEQRAADVEAAGGSIVVPVRQVGEMGIYAQVKDTEGNIIGLWQSLRQ